MFTFCNYVDSPMLYYPNNVWGNVTAVSHLIRKGGGQRIPGANAYYHISKADTSKDSIHGVANLIFLNLIGLHMKNWWHIMLQRLGQFDLWSRALAIFQNLFSSFLYISCCSTTISKIQVLPILTFDLWPFTCYIISGTFSCFGGQGTYPWNLSLIRETFITHKL